MLVIFSGLPGVGKTTIAKELARRIHAAYLRIDTFEVAIFKSGALDLDEDDPDIGPAGYYAAYAVAGDQLKLGLPVVSDSVNATHESRDAWRDVAVNNGSAFLEVEVVCSNIEEHKRRVENRVSDIPGFDVPDWEKVSARQYDPWTRDRLVIDSALMSPEEAVDVIAEKLGLF